MGFTIRTALLLCSLAWLSPTESLTLVLQPGENVTLLCSNFSTYPTHIVWFRLVNRTKPCCISIYNSIEPAFFCSGVDPEKFEVASNISTIFLKIKHVDLSDSGFYFCGYYSSGHPVIVNSTYLHFQDKWKNVDKWMEEEAGNTTDLLTLILSAVTVVLTKVIICLVVKMRLQTVSALGPVD